METQENTHIEVVVISGLIASGKSRLLNQLIALPEYKNATVVRKDEVTRVHWGNREVDTKTGLLFGNELTRNAVKTELVLNRPRRLFLEMPMLTRDKHQRPFLAMLDEARHYVEGIERERAEKEKRSPPGVEIVLKVILLYADPETSIQRVEKRIIQKTANEVFDKALYLYNAARFELPDETTYLPLAIDTSYPENHQENFSDVRSFLDNGTLVRPKTNRRLLVAQTYLDQAKRIAA